MSNLSDIKNRMKVISDTRKITGAMDTISVAKLSKAMERCECNNAYFETLRTVIGDIILHTSSWVHSCFKARETHNAIFIVIASDKGFAGSFNHDVCEYANGFIQTYEKPIVIAVGQTAKEYFEKRQGVCVISDFCDRSFDPDIEDAAEIAEYVVHEFKQKRADEIFVVYTARRPSQSTGHEKIMLLPLVSADIFDDSESLAKREARLSELYYEPSPEEVLDSLIPQYVAGMLYGCMLQSKVAEHSARRAAMSAAGKNADELLEDLKLEYNRARQSMVTGEITDIITAASGVNNEK